MRHAHVAETQNK